MLSLRRTNEAPLSNFRLLVYGTIKTPSPFTDYDMCNKNTISSSQAAYPPKYGAVTSKEHDCMYMCCAVSATWSDTAKNQLY